MTFTATVWNTANDKAGFAATYKRFVLADFAEQQFTKSFYRRLSMMFGHIAHYDRDGFYNTWFTTTVDKLAFVQHALREWYPGDPAWTWSDVEDDLRRWLVESNIEAKYTVQLEQETESDERAQLARLTAKYTNS